MVADVHFERVTGLPLSCRPNTIYFVKGNGSSGFTLYVTGNDSVPFPLSFIPPAVYIPVIAGAALGSGSLVNLYSDAGQAKMRLATNADETARCDGFVAFTTASGALGFLFGAGQVITGLSGLTPGAKYYLGTAGGVTAVVPTTPGFIMQEIGVALSATTILCNPKTEIIL